MTATRSVSKLFPGLPSGWGTGWDEWLRGEWWACRALAGGFSLRPTWLLPWSLALLSFTVQPDPPTNITVSAVSEKPHWLSITWQDPVSWNSNFYRLRFQIRYRAERSQAFTEWIVSSSLASRQRCVPRRRKRAEGASSSVFQWLPVWSSRG